MWRLLHAGGGLHISLLSPLLCGAPSTCVAPGVTTVTTCRHLLSPGKGFTLSSYQPPGAQAEAAPAHHCPASFALGRGPREEAGTEKQVLGSRRGGAVWEGRGQGGHSCPRARAVRARHPGWWWGRHRAEGPEQNRVVRTRRNLGEHLARPLRGGNSREGLGGF